RRGRRRRAAGRAAAPAAGRGAGRRRRVGQSVLQPAAGRQGAAGHPAAGPKAAARAGGGAVRRRGPGAGAGLRAGTAGPAGRGLRQFGAVRPGAVRRVRRGAAALEPQVLHAAGRRNAGHEPGRVLRGAGAGPRRAPKGEPIVIHFAASAEAEAKWIARKIEQLRHEAAAAGGALPYDRVGVLVRANYRAQDMSRVFERAGLPHVTVEQFDFFRRQEIKDAIALLRFALNPADAFSFRRTLRRPPQGIGDATLAAVEEAHEHGLRLVDMVSPLTRRFGEPFAHILEAYERGAVTIFDTETTGKMPGYDEIVELAALRLEGGRVAGSFRKFLRNTVPVGDSEQIHGWSDEYLREHGEDPARVLAEFADFAAGSVLVGHNVNFDISMVQGQAERLGVRVPMDSWADTWEMARRFVRADNYSLEKLVETLGLSAGRAHHASYDVQATCELLQHLMPAVRRGAAARREAVARFRHQFEPVARRMDALRAQVGVQ